MIAQTNVWSIVGVSGLRGQEIANKVLPGLGYLLVVLVVLGGLAFNIGNVGGVSLGFNAMIGIPEKAGVIIGGVLAICIFLSKKANASSARSPRSSAASLSSSCWSWLLWPSPPWRCGRPYLYP